MNAPEPDSTGASSAAEEIARLHATVAFLQSQLAQCRDGRVRVGDPHEPGQAALLLEANEQLVVTALRLQEEVDTSAGALETLEHIAKHDVLTGLPNRALLLEQLERAMAFSRRRSSRLALLFLDLNDFKEVNDTLGHAVGDEVLSHVADCLSVCVRETDVVSRHGGDEFLVLLSEISEAADAARVAEKMIASLAVPFRARDHVLRLTVSVGISIYPDDAIEAAQLVGCADAAMYRAKNEGAGSFVYRGTGVTAQRLAGHPSLASLRRPLKQYETALFEDGQRLDELQEANEALVVAALDARERQAVAEKAQRKHREFLGIVAHELRNPLAPIRYAVAAMSQVRPIEPLLPKMQAVIERQVASMSRLIEDLLDVTRIESGKLSIDSIPASIVAIVDAAVEAARPGMDARVQIFNVQMPGDDIWLVGDPGRLVQVLSNVLNNASKYTPEGGAIDLKVEAAGADVVLTVTDTGIGISTQVLATIFEPFAQSAEAIGYHGGGLGIGLSVVRELVEAHRGHVTAESAGTGLGSRFVIRLPLLANRAAS